MKRKLWMALVSAGVAAVVIGCAAAGEGGHMAASTSAPGGAEASAVTPTPVPTPETGVTREAIAAVTLSDVPTDTVYRDAVAYGIAAGYLQGNGAGRYMPDELVTRAAAVTVLQRMSGDPLMAYDGRFADVRASDWYAGAVAWGCDAGVITGDKDGNFYPDQLLTRQQLAVLLYRCAQQWGWINDNALVEYVSASDGVSPYAQEAVDWANSQGIFMNVVTGKLHPELPVSRGQFAQTLLALVTHSENGALPQDLMSQYAIVSAPAQSTAKHAAIQAAVDAAAQKYGAIGLQVAVIENGDVADTYAYGWATRNTDPMTADHKLRIASISKVVLGMGAMHLMEEGVVSLDAPIGDYWGVSMKNPYYPDKPISIRNMMSHTSSIYLAGDDVSREYAAVKSRHSAGKGFSQIVPGSIYSWGYNNYAFGVLGMTLELAAKEPMDQVLGDAYFDILGIDAAFESGSIENTDMLCTIYEHGGGIGRSVQTQKGLTLNPTPGATGRYFAGGLTISAADMGKLVALLAGDGSYQGLRLMDASSVALMETKAANATVSDGFYQCYPLRYRTNIYGRSGLYYHTGSAYGVYNCMSYDPATGDGVVVLTTGASASKDGYGIYAVCGEIQNDIYNAIK